jgi:hypothetical protein
VIIYLKEAMLCSRPEYPNEPFAQDCDSRISGSLWQRQCISTPYFNLSLKYQSKASTQTYRRISTMTLIPEQIQALIRLIQDSTDLKERLQRATSIDEATSLLSQAASNTGLAIEASSIKRWIEEQSMSADTLNDSQLDAVAAAAVDRGLVFKQPWHWPWDSESAKRVG